MALLVNLRHLEDKNLHLRGELSVADLELERLDEMIHVSHPLSYDLEVQKLDQGVLVQGSLALLLDCECVRCLGAYRHFLKLDHWACHLALSGEEKIEVVNDLVDLTPYVREDIVLAFPQHPLCKPDCRGLVSTQTTPEKSLGGAAIAESTASAWAALDRLKLSD